MKNQDILAPAGMYLPLGATTPVADPGGTYSAAGATAPTQDPAGTYTSSFALTGLFLKWNQITPDNAVLKFTTMQSVLDYYGDPSHEATEARQFFDNGLLDNFATMIFTRIPLGQRPHLLGANLANIPLSQLAAINGSVSITLDGDTYTGHVNASTITATDRPTFMADLAVLIRNAFNHAAPTKAVTTGTTISPESLTFQGYFNFSQLYVTDGTQIPLGSMISGPGFADGETQVIANHGIDPITGYQHYSVINGPRANLPLTNYTANWGVMTVGDVTSGAVAVGQQVQGNGVLPLTAVVSNISGSGAGSQWLVSKAQSFQGNINTTAVPFTVETQSATDSNGNFTNYFFEVQPNPYFGYSFRPSDLSYAGGTAADALGLTEPSGALDASPGGIKELINAMMNNPLYGDFGQYQADNRGRFIQQLSNWQTTTKGLGHLFLPNNFGTQQAGASAPITDPAGTWSAAGASAPILDKPGTWSGPGASAPILALATTSTFVGEYVPQAGSSAPTLCDPGYYCPRDGMTKELPIPPGISLLPAPQSTHLLPPTEPQVGTFTRNPLLNGAESLLSPAGSYLPEGHLNTHNGDHVWSVNSNSNPSWTSGGHGPGSV